MQLITNIKSLLTLDDAQGGVLGEIARASILIDNDRIFWCGPEQDRPQLGVEHILDARDCMVLPGLIDCHAHLIFAGTRADEFARRMNAESYEAIMKMGGGIMSTVRATRLASDEDLYTLAYGRASRILALGTTTIEAKSGYGLSLKEELRALHLIKMLNENHALDFHPTFMGAHVIPPEFKDQPQAYVDLICGPMLDAVAKQQLAIDCDVFCERGAFSVADSLRILARAHELGLGLRAHVQQLSHSGGISLLKELPIKSISHADFLSADDLLTIGKSKTVVEALPIAGLFVRSTTHTPVEELVKQGTPVALATDFNPGSAMGNDLVLAARLGVCLYGFTIENAVLAITKHAALSLGRSDIGVIKAGNKADLVLTNCGSINDFFYDWTKHPVKTVIKNGQPLSGGDGCEG